MWSIVIFGKFSYFGFCQKFIECIKVLYSGIESILKVICGLCARFNVYRGVMQGCSLSDVFYYLAIEPLLLHIRAKLHCYVC